MKKIFCLSLGIIMAFIIMFGVAVEAQDREICWYCNGSGACSYCEDGKCHFCEYGKCPTCDGNGFIFLEAEPHLMESGIFEERINCNDCYGSGNCQKCQGRGECSECYGSAKCQFCWGSGFWN